MKLPSFDPVLALRRLVEHRVEFVVIGGIAGRLLGSPTVTNDLDICYARNDENHAHLAEALVSLNARLRGVDEEVPLQLDAKTIANGDSFTFITDAGSLDILGTPSGTNGFEDLVRTATDVNLDGITVKVCDIEDLLRMKRASARPKDLIEVEVLNAVREELGS